MTLIERAAKASMRPRQACLGIRDREPPHVLLQARASMRPRQACLGIRRQASLEMLIARYDASMRPRQACLGILALCVDQRRSSITGFNEAEASLPRNTAQITGVNDPLGSGFNEAEASLPRNTLHRRMRSARQTLRFNEAEASLPRNTAR